MSSIKAKNNKGYKYNHLIGTGGIGSGIFFTLEGDKTLGRNESRRGKLEPFQDFCKQHIIVHYVSVLLGAGESKQFQAFPIGKVGDDEVGKKLLSMMKNVGMDTKNVSLSKEDSTLFSVCFQYPDKSGGNITTSNSASDKVNPFDIINFYNEYNLDGKKAIVLAVPEVPVDTRIELLKNGKNHDSLNVASMLSSEHSEFRDKNVFELIDVLSINIDEAQSIAGKQTKDNNTYEVIETCCKILAASNRNITVLITDGSLGSYCYNKGAIEFTSSIKTKVKSTAGAGDAFLAGYLVGISCGLSTLKKQNKNLSNSDLLSSAVEFATLVASMSVTSSDTINFNITPEQLYSFIIEKKIKISEKWKKLFLDSC